MTDPSAVVDEFVAGLPEWLPEQRWFAGKDRPITGARRLGPPTVLPGEPPLAHVLVEISQADRRECYQLLVDATGREAATDPELAGRLLTLIAHDQTVGALRFRPEPEVTLATGLPVRPIGAEQSNTSLVFGGQYILKLFRKLSTGDNRDLVLHRALQGVGGKHIAPLLGSISGVLPGGSATGEDRHDGHDGEDGNGSDDSAPVTLGMLQEYLSDAVDGWAMATTSVRDLLADPRPGAGPDAEGGDFAAEARRLGAAVATVHADLRRALGTSEVSPAEFAAGAAAMHARLDAMTSRVPELAPHAPALRAAFDRLAELREPVLVQPVHGDLHLGQVLRTVNGWVLIDFEGEPAAPASERAAPRSPLRDVAGMLRSFDYAAHHLLVEAPAETPADAPVADIATRAHEWARRNRAAFCDGYAEVGGPLGDPRAHDVLLRALELDKAVYEVGYEHANRPAWLSIPLSSIASISARTTVRPSGGE